MRFRAVLAVAAVGLLTGGLRVGQSIADPKDTATEAAGREQPIPADLAQDVERSGAIGRLLYVFDKVAAIGTDALLAEVPDLQRRGVAGYIPMQEMGDDGAPTSSFLVSFFTTDVPPRIAYTIRVTPNAKPIVTHFTPPKEAPSAFAVLARARQLAIGSAPSSGQPLNPVLVPAQAIGETGVLVYLLAGTDEPDVVVLGRHTRVRVSEDGTRVLAVTPLTNSVMEMSTRSPDGGSVAAITVTHTTTDYPLETHVFASLLHRLPIYVLTARGVWRVQGDAIAFLGDTPAAERSRR
jgi:hypothetical protein